MLRNTPKRLAPQQLLTCARMCVCVLFPQTWSFLAACGLLTHGAMVLHKTDAQRPGLMKLNQTKDSDDVKLAHLIQDCVDYHDSVWPHLRA